MSIARHSLQMTGLFEAELLVELMLRYWRHPLADDEYFRQDLLERAAEALHLAAAGNQLIAGLPGTQTNLVAAIWYAEKASLEIPESPAMVHQAARAEWLATVQHSLPSCFCDPDLLP